MKIKAFTGLLDSNTYMVYTDSGEAMIIDAGAEPDKLISFASSNGLKVKYIALTHGHVDHADYVGAYIFRI